MVEPQNVYESLQDTDWVLEMHEELNNFKRNKVWTLVERPSSCRNVIGTKWVFKNKQDEHAWHGSPQQGEISGSKVTHKWKEWTMERHIYAPVARLE
jgi:hypothetical protein